MNFIFSCERKNWNRTITWPAIWKCACQAGALIQQDKLIQTELVLPRLSVISDDRTRPISGPVCWIILVEFENQPPYLHIKTWPTWANLHIQDRSKRCPFANVHEIFANFFLNTLCWTSLVEFENQLICISKMATIALVVYSPHCYCIGKKVLIVKGGDFHICYKCKCKIYGRYPI